MKREIKNTNEIIKASDVKFSLAKVEEQTMEYNVLVKVAGDIFNHLKKLNASYF